MMAYPPSDGTPRPTPGYQGPYVTPQPSGYQAPTPRPGMPPGVLPQAPSPHGGTPPGVVSQGPLPPGGLAGLLGRLFGRRKP